jgi:Cu/Ag efflux protein CusF
MKPKIVLTVLAVLTLVAVIFAVTLSQRHLSLKKEAPAQARAFQVHGQIRGIDPIAKTIRISHEEIPNYMPAMTMSLPVNGSALVFTFSGCNAA